MREMDLIWMLVVTRDALVGVKYGAARNTPDVHLVYTLRAAARPHRTAPHGTEKMMDEPRQFSGLIQSKTPRLGARDARSAANERMGKPKNE
jgi:hypothetical protein